MRRPFLAVLLLAAPLCARTAPEAKLPPANPIAYAADAGEAGVLKAVRTLLDGLEAGDSATILAMTRPEGGLATASTDVAGASAFRRQAWAEVASGGRTGIEERLPDPAVEIDGDIAMVWGSYVARANGQADHCGVDHFDLVRDHGGWRVLNLTRSQRRTGCA